MLQQRTWKNIISGLVITSFFLTTILAFSPPAWSVPEEKTLTVGLYPWVPRLEQFKESIKNEWKKIEPGVKLNILPSTQDPNTDEKADVWDGGYDVEPPESADVYVFDAIFLNYFRAQDWLLPLNRQEVNDVDDFLPYAINGAKSSTEEIYYAIPQLGCTNILFYWNTDTELQNASNLDDIERAIGECTYSSQEPPDGEGLMIDMAGGTTNACLYIDALASTTNKFPVSEPLTPCELDSRALTNLRKLLRMSSYDNATKDTETPYTRANWFSNGKGRAVVGFTESMSAMNPDALDKIDFKVMPLANNDQQALFYADLIGINPKVVERGNRELAVKLANLLASSHYIIESIRPDSSGIPQYLMPTRRAVFEKLKQDYPNYEKMYDLVKAANPILFTLDNQARTWLTTMKKTIRDEIRKNYTCNSKLNFKPIRSQQYAK